MLPLHPKLVHLPIALSFLLPLIGAGVLLQWFRGSFPRRVWWIPAVLSVLLVLSAGAAMNTGEADEDRVESVVGHDLIHDHEEAAEAFTYAAAAVALLALLGLFLKNERAARSLAAASVAASLVVLGLAFRVGELGGELVYAHGAANAYLEGGAASAPGSSADGESGGEEDDDDDESD